MTSIQDIPTDVLQKIFEFLDTRDLSRCSLVTKSWLALVHLYIGLDVKIGSAPETNDYYKGYGFGALTSNWYQDIPDPNPDTKVMRVSSSYGEHYGLKSAWIAGATRGTTRDRGILISSWYLVQKIIIESWKRVDTLLLFTQQLRNLKEFTIGQGVLLQLVLEEGAPNWEFPTLKTMAISGKQLGPLHPQVKEFERAMRDVDTWKQMIRNILFILNHFNVPRLEALILQDVKVSSTKQEDVIVEDLVRFVIAHKATLRKLSIGICQAREAVPINSRLATPINYEELGPQLRGVKLTSFFVHNARPAYASRRSQQLLSLLLQSQAQTESSQNILKHLVSINNPQELYFFDPTTHLIPNNNCLETVEITVSPKIETLSCQAFGNCHSLKTLTLISGNRAWRNDQGEVSIVPIKAKVTNLASLPAGSLKSLRISGFEVSSAELQWLGQDQVHLDILELQRTGHENGLGLHKTSLAQIMFKKQIQLICLKLALNSTDNANAQLPLGVELAFALLLNAENLTGALLLKLTNGRYEQQVEGYKLGMEPASSFAEQKHRHWNCGVRFPTRTTTPGIPATKYPFALEYDNLIVPRRELDRDEYFSKPEPVSLLALIATLHALQVGNSPAVSDDEMEEEDEDADEEIPEDEDEDEDVPDEDDEGDDDEDDQAEE